MTSRAKTVVRAAIFAAICALALALFVRPFERRSRVQYAAPPEMTEPPPPPRFVPHPTPEGLVAIDSRALLDRMKQSKARGVMVGAWASWCGSCKVDIPVLIGLRETFGADIEVWLVSVDEPEARPAAARMLKDFGETRESFVVEEPLDAFKAAMHPLWPGMLPATFLFDTAANVHYFWGGPAAESEITPLLRRYLAGENIDGHSNFALIRGQGAPERGQGK
jgi:thiol-disulfide isomerase/thioredoxin